MTKQEFGRRLQKLLDERNWSQSDLARKIAAIAGAPERRDAVSTYIKGRSFPTQKSLNLLCQALGVSREELLPNPTFTAVQDEHPTFAMRTLAGHPGRMWVSLDRMVRSETAIEIARLLSQNDAEDAAVGEQSNFIP